MLFESNALVYPMMFTCDAARARNASLESTPLAKTAIMRGRGHYLASRAVEVKLNVALIIFGCEPKHDSNHLRRCHAQSTESNFAIGLSFLSPSTPKVSALVFFSNEGAQGMQPCTVAITSSTAQRAAFRRVTNLVGKLVVQVLPNVHDALAVEPVPDVHELRKWACPLLRQKTHSRNSQCSFQKHKSSLGRRDLRASEDPKERRHSVA